MSIAEAAVPARAVNIVIADDHGVVRGGLRAVLQQQEGFHVVGEAYDVPSTLRVVDASRPDILVLDLNMPGQPGLDAIPVLRERFPDTHIVVLTMQDEPVFARAALTAGAEAFVLKESAEAELLKAIDTVLGGETYLNPTLGARIARAHTDRGPHDDLTDREREILRLIALGYTNSEIGSQLFLSVRTVESHRAHIQHKTGRTTRAQLVAHALDLGLLADH